MRCKAAPRPSAAGDWSRRRISAPTAPRREAGSTAHPPGVGLPKRPAAGREAAGLRLRPSHGRANITCEAPSQGQSPTPEATACSEFVGGGLHLERGCGEPRPAAHDISLTAGFLAKRHRPPRLTNHIAAVVAWRPSTCSGTFTRMSTSSLQVMWSLDIPHIDPDQDQCITSHGHTPAASPCHTRDDAHVAAHEADHDLAQSPAAPNPRALPGPLQDTVRWPMP